VEYNEASKLTTKSMSGVKLPKTKDVSLKAGSSNMPVYYSIMGKDHESLTCILDTLSLLLQDVFGWNINTGLADRYQILSSYRPRSQSAVHTISHHFCPKTPRHEDV